MYKIKNCSNNALPIPLEKGSTILAPGKSLDIDGLCSRKWIRSNKELQHLLTPNVNALVLIHDSETGVRPQITKDVRRNAPKSKKPKEKPVIVDFSDVGDVEQDEPIVEDLSEPEPEEVKVEEPVEAPVEDIDAEMVIEEPEWEDETKEELEDGMIPCPVCGKPCKGDRGLAVHSRSHKED